MVLFISLLLFSGLGFAAPATHASVCQDRGPNVILVTMDGVRPREFFGEPACLRKVPKKERGIVFKNLWGKYKDSTLNFGNRGFGGRFRIGAKIALSLPSYQAIMAGRPTSCHENDCGRIKEETFLERIQKDLNLGYTDVAAIASWRNIEDAVAKTPGKFFVHVGAREQVDLDDPVLAELAKAASQDLPPWKGKWDVYTGEMSLHYLETYCPRVLYISFLDPDEWGHLNEYLSYVRSLRQVDEFMDRLYTKLDSMGAYGANTTVFLTTDHSRGSSFFFPKHAVTKFTEKNIFLHVRGPHLRRFGRQRDHSRSSLYLRDTIEALLGLEPTAITGRALLINSVLPKTVKNTELN